MTLALLLILTLAWVAVTGAVTAPNLLLGFGLALLATWLLRRTFALPPMGRRLVAILALAGLFVRELLVSALRVARLVLTPNLASRLRPAIIAFPLSVTSDLEITLLANLITLTPGTLSIDVSHDRRMLYVHVLTLGDREALIAELAQGFEARVKAVFA